MKIAVFLPVPVEHLVPAAEREEEREERMKQSDYARYIHTVIHYS